MGPHLKIFTDGGARGNPGPGASAFAVLDDHGKQIYSGAKYLGVTTNNKAEYEAVLLAVEWLSLQKETFEDISFYLDSLLVVKQLTGEFKIKDEALKEMHSKIIGLIKQIGEIKFLHIPREKNEIADGLVNKILDETLLV